MLRLSVKYLLRKLQSDFPNVILEINLSYEHIY